MHFTLSSYRRAACTVYFTCIRCLGRCEGEIYSIGETCFFLSFFFPSSSSSTPTSILLSLSLRSSLNFHDIEMVCLKFAQHYYLNASINLHDALVLIASTLSVGIMILM
jgi:hypothetical protein